MSTNFPTTLDTFPNATTLSGHNLDTDPHSTLHGNLGDAVAALEAKVGADSSAVTTSLDYKMSHRLVTTNNLSDLTSATTARTNLGLGSLATVNSPVPIANGGTGVATQQLALNALAGATTNNQVLAGNGTNVTLRALASADIPSLDFAKITTGTVPVNQGGTGQTTVQAALNALAGATTNNLVLAGNGTNVTLRALAVADLPTGTSSSAVPVGGVITAGGPQGDSSHTQVLTWNAAGQVTAVTNTAIGSLAASVITSGTVAIANGGTNAATAAAAKTNLTVGYAVRTFSRMTLK